MKLGTRLFVFSSIFLVLLPLSGYQFIEKIEQSLLQGQQEAQSMVASAIATTLKGYRRLFQVDENAHYVYPVEQGVTVDGYAMFDEDWTRLQQQFTRHSGRFSLLLLNDNEYLYVYMKVQDKEIIYRNPRFLYLDSSDHIRLEYMDESNQRRRLVLLTEGQGSLSVYEVNKDWRTWKTGQHVSAVYGVWSETGSGYDVELRLPLKWLQSDHRLSLAVVDVFGENERYPESIVSTSKIGLEAAVTDSLNLLIFQSAEISSVMKNLNEFDSRLCVIDKYSHIRAVTAGKAIASSFCQATDKVDEKWVNEVLQGREQVVTIRQDGETLIVAAQAVYDGDEIIGAVLVASNSRQMLSAFRDTLLDILLVILALFLLVTISLFIFSSWLAFRINRLKQQISSVIDEHGRFISRIKLSDAKHPDEIGELSRSFSSLLDKLNTYTGFLETIPRMLRHEILNPVNTISMSLQHLKHAGNTPEIQDDVQAACHAIEQLQLIVSSLTEAACIDDVLKNDPLEVFDIAALLTEYVRNSQLKHASSILRYHGVQTGIWVRGNDIRLVQLLDKLKDNAIDFAIAGSEVSFHLDVNQLQQVIICVKNEGLTIPQQQLNELFSGMISFRKDRQSSSKNVPHLGIGLFVAFQIAKFHDGELSITNRDDKQGVELSLILPQAPPA